jgi:hypothetical protein
MSVIERSAEPEQRLKDLGINLPQPPKPLGAYVEAVQTGNSSRPHSPIIRSRRSPRRCQ